jgi:hypothetical protein
VKQMRIPEQSKIRSWQAFQERKEGISEKQNK